MGSILAMEAQIPDGERHGSSLSEATVMQHFQIVAGDGLTPGNPGLGWTHLAVERDPGHPDPWTTIPAPRAPTREVPMDFLRPDLQERLLKEHFEFRRLMEEHKAADEKLVTLQRKSGLSARESLEEVELKKTKLRAKERIYQIVQEADRSH